MSWLFAGFLPGFVLTVLLRTRRRRGGRWAALAGVGVAVGVFIWGLAREPEDAFGLGLVVWVWWLVGVGAAVGSAAAVAGFRSLGE